MIDEKPESAGKRIQEDLSHEKYLEGIVASLRESLVVLDASFNVVSASKSFFRTFNLTTADIEQRNFFELDAGRWDTPALRQRLATVLPSNAPLDDYEVEQEAESGSVRTFLINAHHIDRDACKRDLIVVAIEDITRRKQIENDLLRQRELLRVLLDNFPASIYYKDLQSRFTEVSRFKAHRHGCEPAELIGKTDFDVFPEERARKAFDDEQKILRTGEAMIGMEEKESWSDRPDTWTLTSKMQLKDHAGKPIGTFGISHDITERKRAENELRLREVSLQKANAELARSNAELAQFAYVASHDLQEPLRTVAGCIQILREQCKEKLDADGEELMAHVVGGAQRMKELIQDLLAFSRVGNSGLPFQELKMEAVLDETLKNLAVSILEAEATVTHDPLPEVSGDAGQLRQLMQNLIGNAIKFCGSRKPHVHVSATHVDGAWQISVRDNGIGIEPQYFDRIFAVFQRLHTRDEYPGTGIGLAICKKVVDRHGGRIWIESTHGQGTTFFFTIPDAQVEA